MKASDLRLQARNSLKGQYWPAVLVAFVAAIFGALIATSASLNMNIDIEDIRNIRDLSGAIKLVATAAGVTLGVVSLVQLILGGVVWYSYMESK